jgi:uncharacterized RmlC-like cupin family protein
VARPHVEILASPEVTPAPLPAAGWPAEAGGTARVLSRDPLSGAVSALVELAPGATRPAGHHAATAVDLYVVSGALRMGGDDGDDGIVAGPGWFGYWPAGTSQDAWEAGPEGAVLFLGARATAPDLAPGPGPAGDAGVLGVDTEALEWELAPEGPPDEQIAGLPPGIVMKTLRWVEETGELLALCANVPRWRYPRLEFHECVEEAFMLRGDIWLGSSGTMHAGDYFWRPPYITHGPFWSTGGSLFLVYTDTLLVDHVAESPHATPDENRAQLARQRAQA